jgi:hypothetical protein
MQPNEYLQAVLDNQSISKDDPEYKELQNEREAVEEILRNSFKGADLSIRYGGSVAKGTMIRESYDLDITCYFAHKDTTAGGTLEEIYNNVREALSTDFFVQPKTSSLRLMGKDEAVKQVDFHIDVVPGQYVDENEGDVFLYQASAEKSRLKTNLDKHIQYIKNSGLIDEIKLAKLWKARKAIMDLKTFVLELLVIKILKEDAPPKTLEKRLTLFWQTLKDEKGKIAIEDPANRSGNDLSAYLATGMQTTLSLLASATLDLIDSSGWEAIFGDVKTLTDKEKIAAITSATSKVSTRTRPWCGQP